MHPPGNVNWNRSEVELGGVTRHAFVTTFTRTPEAQLFVDLRWDSAYEAGGALFVNQTPLILGEPVDFTPTGLPCYRPTPQPPEVWFLPDAPFTGVWPFAKRMASFASKLPDALRDACDSFLCDLSSRQPIGVEAIGEGVAIIRRYKDGGTFDIADMRRACDLNVAVLGGPQDASHTDKGMPRHFVEMGFFYFGM